MGEQKKMKIIRQKRITIDGEDYSKGITLIALAISRKCVRYEERA